MPTLTTSIQHNTKDPSSATGHGNILKDRLEWKKQVFYSKRHYCEHRKNLWSQQKTVRNHEFCKPIEYINVQINQPHFYKSAVNELLEMNLKTILFTIASKNMQ